MTVSPKTLLETTPVPNAAAAIFTAPALTTCVITRGAIINITAGAVALTLWLVPSGGARANGNIIVGASAAGVNIAAGPTDGQPLAALAGLVLAPGDAIHALASAATSLNLTISGYTSV